MTVPTEQLLPSGHDGDQTAIQNLTLRFYYGLNNEPIDLRKALFWSSKASSAKDKQGLYINGVLQLCLRNDPVAAYNKFNNASRSLHGKATYLAALCLRNGFGVLLSPLRAYEKLQDGVEVLNDPLCMIGLGDCYKFGVHVDVDYSKARYYYDLAKETSQCDRYRTLFQNTLHHAENGGCCVEMHVIGICYYHGIAVPQDESKALYWLDRSSQYKYAEAFFYLGHFYQHGLGTDEDEVKAISFYKKAADLDHPWAMNKIGEIYDSQMDAQEDAFHWHFRAARTGCPRSMFKTALAYDFGAGVAVDKELAYDWYSKAVDAGFNFALVNLGKCWFTGSGIKKNPEKCFNAFLQAAQLNYAEAMVYVGHCYLKGVGVDLNTREAFLWYSKAAERGRAEGIFEVGMCKLNGVGCDEDTSDAYQSFLKAAELEYYPAKEKVLYCLKHSIGVATDYSLIDQWESELKNRKIEHHGDSNCSLM
ncbi:hypothetical protein GEMRC1_003022 [Eukaryota sp. GEM-RC1]